MVASAITALSANSYCQQLVTWSLGLWDDARVGELFRTIPLSSRGNTSGFFSRTVNFAERPIIATIALSSYRFQEPEHFSSFRPAVAETWIETPNTPTLHIPGTAITFPNADRDVDQQVRLRTSWVKFQMRVENVAAAAVGCLYESEELIIFLPTFRAVNYRLVDAAGSVVGEHEELQLEGGPDFDADQIAEGLARPELPGAEGWVRAEIVEERDQ